MSSARADRPAGSAATPTAPTSSARARAAVGRRRSGVPPSTSTDAKPDGLVHGRQPRRRRLDARVELDRAVVRRTRPGRVARSREERRARPGTTNAATSPAAIRGSSRSLASSSAPASSASAVTSDDEQGRGRERAAELLEHDHRLEQREPGAVVLLRDRQRGHADLLAERLPQRLVVAGLGGHRGPDRGRSARLASSERTVAASSCCSSVNANSISASSVRRAAGRGGHAGVPHAVTSARILVSHMLRSNSAV